MYEPFLQTLSSSPYHACNAICETFFALHNPNSSSIAGRKRNYHKYIELFVILQTLFKKGDIPYKNPELKEDLDHNISLIVDFFIQSRKSVRKALDLQNTEELIDKYRAQYESNILNSFSYQFNEQQLKATLDLITQLRTEIKPIRSLSILHRSRLIASLDRLQSVLHKDVANMDHFWGLMLETRLILKKRTADLKPIIEGIQNIANIYYQVISASGDELPFQIQNFLPTVTENIDPIKNGE